MAQLIKGKQIKSQTVTINGYTGNVVVQGNLNMGANLVTTTASSFSNNNLVTKAYVDSVAQGLDPKESVVTATVTSENITIETPGSTIGGYTLSIVGSRILLKNQTITTQNGIYSWNGVDVPMTRTTDSDGTPASEVTLGNFTFVEKGTNASTGWVLSSSDSTTSIVIPDTNTQLWTLFSGAGTYSADGQGIEVSGGQFYLEIDGTTLYKSVNGLKLSDSISTAISNSTVGVTSLTTRVSIEETVRQTGDVSLTTRVSVEEYTSSIAVSNGTVADNSLTTRISLEESNRLVDISNGIVADISLTTRISLEESNRLVDISQRISTDVSLSQSVSTDAYNLSTMISQRVSVDSLLQPKSDPTLNTNSKIIVNAINEINDIAKGATQALVENDYETFIGDALQWIIGDYNIGQTFYILTIDVPDLWLSGTNTDNFVSYTYTTDQQFIDDINLNNGMLQVGYYYVSKLETQKVDQSINEGSINAVAGGAVFNALGNKVDKVAGKSLLDDTEISKLAKINVNTVNTEYTVTDSQKINIDYSRTKVDELTSLYGNYSAIQKNHKQFVSTVMNLEKSYSCYTMSLSQNSSVTFNTSLLDIDVTWSFDVYFDISNFISVAFPQSVYFYGGNQMVDIGLYHYKFESIDNGLTWTAYLISKKIQYLSSTGKVVYVKLPANGGSDSNDGLSWATAKATLAGANVVASIGDVVFMQSGKYYVETYRTAGVENSRSFIIKNGVSIYGGFAGTEISPDERFMIDTNETLNNPYGIYTYTRSIPANPTILSGEITGDLSVNGATVYGNRLIGASTTTLTNTVVYSQCSLSTIINGFKIMGGYASGTPALVYDNAGFLKIINCELCDAVANRGSGVAGGIYKATVLNSYVHNITNNPFGYNNIFDTTIFAIGSNDSDSTGLSAIGNNFTANHCLISGSKTNWIYGYSNAGSNCNLFNSIIKSCVFTRGNNEDQRVNKTINVVIEDCVMPYFGSTVSIDYIVSSKIINNTFSNSCVYIVNSSTYMANVLIAHNTCVNGAITANSSTYTPILTNLTVVNNLGVTHAGVVGLPIINSVVYGNRIDGLKDNYYTSGTNYPSYSAFENEVVTGTSNVSLSINNEGDVNSPYFKQFISVAGNTESQFDYDINTGSYLIDKGNNNYPSNGDGSLYDCNGETRKVGTVDIGAYEKQNTV